MEKEFDYLLKNEGGVWEKFIRGEIELNSAEVKILTKAEPWVIFLKDSLCEHFDIIENIADTANRTLYEKYKIKLDSWPMSTAVFLKTFESICAMLKSKESNYSNYAINFMNRFVISFNSNVNDEDEKNGNFMIYIITMFVIIGIRNKYFPNIIIIRTTLTKIFNFHNIKILYNLKIF